MSAHVRIAILLLFSVLSTVQLQGCASTDGQGSSEDSSFTLTFSTPETTTLLADGRSAVQLRVLVTDKDRKPVPSATVAFTATSGRLSAASVATRTDGSATVTLTSATTAGAVTVTATSGLFTDSVTLNFSAGDPVVVSLTATPESVNLRGVSIIQATVLDANANPVTDRGIRFLLSDNTSGASLEPSNGSAPASAELSLLTDVNGRVNVIYRAGSVPGTDTIRVVAGAAATSVTISVKAPGVAGTVASTVSAALTNMSANSLPHEVTTAMGDAVTIFLRQIPADFPASFTAGLSSRQALHWQATAEPSPVPAVPVDGTSSSSITVATMMRAATVRAETVRSEVVINCPSRGRAIGNGAVTVERADGSFVLNATVIFGNCNGLNGTLDLTSAGTFATLNDNTVAFDVVFDGSVANGCNVTFDHITESVVVALDTETITATVDGSLELLCRSRTVRCTWQEVDIFDEIALAAGCS